MDLFLDYRDEEGGRLSDRQLRDALLNYLLAGRDTTAESLSWTSFRLIKNPTAVRKIRAECNRHGFYGLEGEFNRAIDVDPTSTSSKELGYLEAKDLHYVRAVYHETLRLHPSVPRSSKVALKDDFLPGGIFIEAGTTLIWSDWLMARNQELWGSDAEEWKPERWLDKQGEIVPQSPWKFHSFNVSCSNPREVCVIG